MVSERQSVFFVGEISEKRIANTVNAVAAISSSQLLFFSKKSRTIHETFIRSNIDSIFFIIDFLSEKIVIRTFDRSELQC